MAVLPGLVEALPLLGIEERDILLTGYPLMVSIGSWATVQPCICAGTSVAVVRASSPHQASIVVNLDGPPGEVVSDILDCVEALLLRRNRRLDQDRAAKEAEMREMVETTGWTCTGVGGAEIMAGFRDSDDGIRGRITRTEYRRGDPASDRFSITVEFGALDYAKALRVLAERLRLGEP